MSPHVRTTVGCVRDLGCCSTDGLSGGCARAGHPCAPVERRARIATVEAQIERRKQLEAQWQAQSAALVAAGGVPAPGSNRALVSATISLASGLHSSQDGSDIVADRRTSGRRSARSCYSRPCPRRTSRPSAPGKPQPFVPAEVVPKRSAAALGGPAGARRCRRPTAARWRTTRSACWPTSGCGCATRRPCARLRCLGAPSAVSTHDPPGCVSAAKVLERTIVADRPAPAVLRPPHPHPGGLPAARSLVGGRRPAPRRPDHSNACHLPDLIMRAGGGCVQACHRRILRRAPGRATGTHR